MATVTGSVKRTVAQKLSDSRSINDFGAKPDGVTISTTSIQAAVDGKGRVSIPRGTYVADDTIDLSDITTLYLEAGAVIQGSVAPVFAGDGGDADTAEIVIEGGGTIEYTGSDTTEAVVDLGGTPNTKWGSIRGITINGNDHAPGLYLHDGFSRGSVERNTFIGCKTFGIRMTASGGNTIANNLFWPITDRDGAGIEIAGSSANLITGNRLLTGAVGILWSEYGNDNTILGNVFEDNTTAIEIPYFTSVEGAVIGVRIIGNHFEASRSAPGVPGNHMLIGQGAGPGTNLQNVTICDNGFASYDSGPIVIGRIYNLTLRNNNFGVAVTVDTTTGLDVSDNHFKGDFTVGSSATAVDLNRNIYDATKTISAADALDWDTRNSHGLLLQRDQNDFTAWQVRNDSAGAAAQAAFVSMSGNFVVYGVFATLGTGFTPDGLLKPDTQIVYSAGADGLAVFSLDDAPVDIGVNNAGAIRVAPTTRNVLIGTPTPTDDTTNKVQVTGNSKFTGDVEVTGTLVATIPAHAAQHKTGGGDALTAADIGAAAATHASQHQNGGGDEIAEATAGANKIPKAGAGGKLDSGWIPDLYATKRSITGGTIALAKITAGGANGSLSIATDGTITGWTAPT